VGEGVLIDLAPVVADECTDQKEKGALGHVEIGDDTLYIMITVTGSYDDLGAGVEYVGVVAVHPREDGTERELA